MSQRPQKITAMLGSAVAAGLTLCTTSVSAQAQRATPQISEISGFQTKTLEPVSRNYIEATGTAWDKSGKEIAVFRLRCGLDRAGNFDPTVEDMQINNADETLYTRIQSINGTTVVTAKNPPAGAPYGAIALQTFTPAGATITKTCTPNFETGQIEHCVVQNRFMPDDDMKQQGAMLRAQCANVMTGIDSDLDKSAITPKQDSAWKAYRDGLQQKLETLR